ncbi:MAG: type IV secretory system conjugative DNA transfer family protein [Hyphomicrobium sp.]|uniref:type IV secretory system conjugative DNA transfer family protein n=1 Tax=Hyphomicrobium sp. TaxID=82 RepID=UPI003D0EFD27
MLDDLPRGVRSRPLDNQKTPLAAWVGPDELACNETLRFSGGKVFLGVVAGSSQRSGTEPFVTGGKALGLGDDRHVVLCAGSRAGKGRSCLIPTLLEYEGSVLAIDPKGELANVTARRRGELGQRICIVDPFGVCAARLEPFKVGFNPLAILAPDSPTLIADAGLIADAIVVGSAQADPHWDESARNLIEAVILHVATYPAYEGERTLVTVREVLKRAFDKVTDLPDGFEGEAPPQVRTELVHNADGWREKGNASLAAALDGAARDFYDKADRERASVLSVALRNTKFLDYPPLRDSLSHHGFDLSQLKTDDAGLTVYLCLPAGRMATCNRWFRLFVNLAIEAMEREKTKPTIPVLAVLEEFHVLGFMQQIEVAAGLIAGFGMKLLIVLQDLTQLKRHYKDGWETFLGNAGIMIFFGNSDMTTLEYISKRCGQTSLIVERNSDVTTSQRTSGATGASWSLEVRDLLTPEEAARFFGRDDVYQRQILIRPGLPPAVIQRVKYDRHELFAGKFDSAE